MKVIEEFKKAALAHKEAVVQIDDLRKVIGKAKEQMKKLKEAASEFGSIAKALAKPAADAAAAAKRADAKIEA